MLYTLEVVLTQNDLNGSLSKRVSGYADGESNTEVEDQFHDVVLDLARKIELSEEEVVCECYIMKNGKVTHVEKMVLYIHEDAESFDIIDSFNLS